MPRAKTGVLFPSPTERWEGKARNLGNEVAKRLQVFTLFVAASNPMNRMIAIEQYFSRPVVIFFDGDT